MEKKKIFLDGPRATRSTIKRKTLGVWDENGPFTKAMFCACSFVVKMFVEVYILDPSACASNNLNDRVSSGKLCGRVAKIWLTGPHSACWALPKQKWRSCPKEEGNLVKTFELSDEIRREGDHGSFGYRKKTVFTHRSRALFLFLRPRKGILLPQSHQSILP